MTNDFFLVERAAQVQRLRAAASGNRIEIPRPQFRLGCSRRAKQLFRTIDRICQIPLSEKRASWLRRVTARSGSMLGLRGSTKRRPEEQMQSDPALLIPKHRLLLCTFERQLVQLQLGEDAEASTAAAAILTAILQDHGFTGLKPLPFHSDNFAYELLFPSWLNLYTALVLPRSDSNEPRFSPEQIKTIFRFLDAFEDRGQSPNLEVVGALTLAANRLPPSEAERLIQRIVDLCCLAPQGPIIASTTKLVALREQTTSATEFLGLLNNLTIFETSAFSDQIVTTYQIGLESPHYETLPESLTMSIQALDSVAGEFALWARLIGQIGHIVDQGGCIDGEFADLLQHRTDSLPDWLALLTPPDNTVPLPRACQHFLALIIRRAEGHPGSLDASGLRAFAHQLAPRLSLLVGPMASFFEKEFIGQDRNRELLLRCTEDDTQRRAIARQLITRAQKTDDYLRTLSQLTVAAILDPTYDSAKLAAIGRTVTVLRSLQEQGFISPNQLEDLASDIRRRLPESMEFLVAPYLGASSQNSRLAKLYLALYEECEKYEHLGETGNFGLTIAAYGNLNRTIDQDRTN